MKDSPTDYTHDSHFPDESHHVRDSTTYGIRGIGISPWVLDLDQISGTRGSVLRIEWFYSRGTDCMVRCYHVALPISSGSVLGTGALLHEIQGQNTGLRTRRCYSLFYEHLQAPWTGEAQERSGM